MEAEVNNDNDVTVNHSEIDITLGIDMKCTINACVENHETNKLQCGQCKRKVHYTCSLLPPYQLQRYLIAGLGPYYSKFVCSNCVKVPDSILKEITMTDNVVSLQNEITMQKEKIECYEQELAELRELVASHRIDTEKISSKKRKIADCSDSTEEAILPEDKAKDTEGENENKVINDLSRMFETRFAKIETKLVDLIQQNLPKLQETENSDMTSPLPYAKVGKVKESINTNFRDIIIAAKNEELAEERDKKLRQHNIIVHGRCESANNEENDQIFINDMMKDLSVGAIHPKSVLRIGKQDSGKPRPIKVAFNSNDDKTKVMTSLRYLKGKEMYTRISITDDYTLAERKMIRDFVEKAKKQNRELGEDAKSIVVVRGTPKNGLFLKEITKEKRAQVQTEVPLSNSQ